MSLTPDSFFRRLLKRSFAVKLQKCFVDDKTWLKKLTFHTEWGLKGWRLHFSFRVKGSFNLLLIQTPYFRLLNKTHWHRDEGNLEVQECKRGTHLPAAPHRDQSSRFRGMELNVSFVGCTEVESRLPELHDDMRDIRRNDQRVNLKKKKKRKKEKIPRCAWIIQRGTKLPFFVAVLLTFSMCSYHVVKCENDQVSPRTLPPLSGAHARTVWPFTNKYRKFMAVASFARRLPHWLGV